MKADRIENIPDIRVPEKWRDIHSAGVLEWMGQSIQQFGRKCFVEHVWIALV
jgi:hypothetical protein